MSIKAIKKLPPLSFQIWGRNTYDRLWKNRRLNNAFFGLLFDLGGGIYREHGCTFEIPSTLTTMGFRARFFFHSYEEHDVELVDKYIRPEDSVLELGACIGFLACVTNRKLASRRRHVVVEANPNLIPWIERNKQRNRCSFTIKNCLVSDSSDGTFYVHDLIVGGSAVRETTRPVRVPVKPVSEILKEAAPTALIVNIEGGELEFLRQARSFLGSVRIAIVDMHDFIIGEQACDECRRILSAAGLHLAEKPGSIEVWTRQQPSAR
jgi:FkbM family methyltransferase